MEEGEGTKFESALPTLPEKVCLGAQWTEMGERCGGPGRGMTPER